MKYLKNFEQLNEGTWLLPDTIEKALKLKMILEKPVLAKHSGDRYDNFRINVLSDVFGSDSLHDRIGEVKVITPNKDVRDIIIDELDTNFVQYYLERPEDFKDPISKEVLSILQDIIKNK